jgi:hypothetical protein
VPQRLRLVVWLQRCLGPPRNTRRRAPARSRRGEKQADSLRLLIVVGGHGAFVAAFRNRAEIVLARASIARERPPMIRP